LLFCWAGGWGWRVGGLGVGGGGGGGWGGAGAARTRCRVRGSFRRNCADREVHAAGVPAGGEIAQARAVSAWWVTGARPAPRSGSVASDYPGAVGQMVGRAVRVGGRDLVPASRRELRGYAGQYAAGARAGADDLKA
jgi:hypothetical protein